MCYSLSRSLHQGFSFDASEACVVKKKKKMSHSQYESKQAKLVHSTINLVCIFNYRKNKIIKRKEKEKGN
jgi:hypothetical protein